MRVTLYTKPDCHLCEVVKVELLDLQTEFDFELIERNILDDETLRRAYRFSIPVVEIAAENLHSDEPIRLQAPISQVELHRQVKRVSAQESART